MVDLAHAHGTPIRLWMNELEVLEDASCALHDMHRSSRVHIHVASLDDGAVENGVDALVPAA
jgi:hypothetical protein